MNSNPPATVDVGLDDSAFIDIRDLQDLKPFGVDPCLGGLHRLGWSSASVGILSFTLVGLLVTFSAALSNSGFWAVRAGRSTWHDFLATVDSTRPKGSVGHIAVPLLRDYPSLVAAFTVACAPWFIYSLFTALSKMHSSLAANGCLQMSSAAKKSEIDRAIRRLNREVSAHGKPVKAIAIYLLCVAPFALAAGLAMRQRGFDYLFSDEDRKTFAATANPDSGARSAFEHWWARPFLPGYFAWCLLGGLGIYMVYIEAVVGLKYVRFLQKHRTQYRFKPTDTNVDDYYGWAVLRTAFTFMIAGIVTSSLCLFPVYHFMRPVVPIGLLAVLFGGFMSVVLYVSIAAALLLRRHVVNAKEHRIRKLAAEIDELKDSKRFGDVIRVFVLRSEVQYFRTIPNLPIAAGWTILAVLVGVLGVAASIAQIVSVL